MVRVAAQEQFLKLSALDTSGLCYTHKAELIRLPDDQVKLDLAKEAIESSLSTRQLSEKVNEACKELSPKNFEIAVAILNNIENPRRIFEDSEIAPFVNDLKSLRKLSLQERRAISVEAKEMSKKTKEWMQKYDKLVRRLDKIDQ
jgi:predicted DNA-binding antitoxin AbrB/MazE fold protein